MKRKIIKETQPVWVSILTILFGLGLSSIMNGVRGSMTQTITNLWRGKKKTEAEDAAVDIALELGYNNKFLQEIAKIILDEGGFKKFLDKVKTPRYETDVFDWHDFDDEGFVKNMGKNATDIVKRLLSLPLVKQKIEHSPYEDKNLLTKALGAQFFLFITQRKFRDALISHISGIGEKLEDYGIFAEKKISLKKLLPKNK